uniref:Uncharacterized protein n=1 Tax=Glossina austeni TaxID=7395 RepID=A0A1A9VCL5_GLOAU
MLGKISIGHFHVSFYEYCIRIIREIGFKLHLRRSSVAYGNVHLNEMMDRVLLALKCRRSEIDCRRKRLYNMMTTLCCTLMKFIVSSSRAFIRISFVLCETVSRPNAVNYGFIPT